MIFFVYFKNKNGGSCPTLKWFCGLTVFSNTGCMQPVLLWTNISVSIVDLKRMNTSFQVIKRNTLVNLGCLSMTKKNPKFLREHDANNLNNKMSLISWFTPSSSFSSPVSIHDIDLTAPCRAVVKTVYLSGTTRSCWDKNGSITRVFLVRATLYVRLDRHSIVRWHDLFDLNKREAPFILNSAWADEVWCRCRGLAEERGYWFYPGTKASSALGPRSTDLVKRVVLRLSAAQTEAQ